jgi:hypothetical protein
VDFLHVEGEFSFLEVHRLVFDGIQVSWK